MGTNAGRGLSELFYTLVELSEVMMADVPDEGRVVKCAMSVMRYYSNNTELRTR